MRRSYNLLDKSVKPSEVIWGLAFPTIIEQFLQTAVIYIDGAMVGLLGAVASASVSLPSSTIWLAQGLIGAMAIGISVQVARNIGAGNPARSREIAKQGIALSFLLGFLIAIVFFILSFYLPAWMKAESAVAYNASVYMRIIAVSFLFQGSLSMASAIMRASGETRIPMLFNLLANIVNLILNWFFIYEPCKIGSLYIRRLSLGVEGAAWASLISFVVGSVSMLVLVFTKDFPARAAFRGSWRVEDKVLREAVVLGAPVAFERSTLCLGQILSTAMASGISTVALAAHHLAINAESITYMPGNGIQTSATTLVAQSLGAGDRELAKSYSSKCILYGTVLMSVTGTLLFIFARPLMAVFSPDERVISLGASMLKIVSFAEPFFGYSMMVSGVLRGAGDTRSTFLISLVGMWLVRLPVAFVLIKFFGFGLAAIWIGMLLDLVSRAVIGAAIYRRGRWLI